MIKLNQSTIKEVNSSAACPRRYYDYHISKELQTIESLPMTCGKYYEYMTLGIVTKSDTAPSMPLLKNGNKSTDQKRIEEQAINTRHFLRANDIFVVGTDLFMETEYNTKVSLFGTADAIVKYNGRDYIMDLKLTKDLTSTFGDYAWGNYSGMNKLQAYMYMFMMKKLTGVDYGFIYVVADYKSNPEIVMFELTQEKDSLEDMHKQINNAYDKLLMFKETSYKPIGNIDGCKRCKVEDCPARMDLTKLKQQEEINDVTEQKSDNSYTIELPF